MGLQQTLGLLGHGYAARCCISICLTVRIRSTVIRPDHDNERSFPDRARRRMDYESVDDVVTHMRHV